MTRATLASEPWALRLRPPERSAGGSLCAVDLDRTLIYSRRALGDDPPPLTPVEQQDGRDVSWMTETAATVFAALRERALVVPVTARTIDQWRRVRLPGPPAEWAVVANGGELLVDGRPDRDWAETVTDRLREVAPLDEVWAEASRLCRPEWTVKLRNADGLFCYAVLHRRRVPADAVAEAAERAAELGWQVAWQGRKLYWVPRTLSKSAAVAEIARRAGVAVVLAAGDSLLDAELLAHADRGIAARHGELIEAGWTAPTVEVTAQSGARAGAEIVDWFARAGT